MTMFGASDEEEVKSAVEELEQAAQALDLSNKKFVVIMGMIKCNIFDFPFRIQDVLIQSISKFSNDELNWKQKRNQ